MKHFAAENARLRDSRDFEESAKAFVDAANAKTLTVGILGLGYVGLPLAEALISTGFRVIGFDVNQRKIDALREGRSYIRHIGGARIQAMNATERLMVTTDVGLLSEADALLICVPTPINAHREPDLSYVIKTSDLIAKVLRHGQLVVLESTTYPGTTEEIIKPILERATGLKAGVDFALAYSPEREDPGNLDYSTETIPKVVGADTEDERAMALALYGSFTKTVPVSDLRTAEAVKLMENIFRLINIGLVNELKWVFGGMGIDIWEVIDAARTKPFGFMPFYPGPGIGGHCIPIDPFYLTWKARAFGLSTRMIDLAGDISAALPRSVVEATSEALDHLLQKPLSSSKILIVGVAYKRNIDDLRESPALPIMQILARRGAKIAYHDPHVASTEHAHTNGLEPMRSIAWTHDILSDFDCAIIVTDHHGVDYEMMLKAIPVVVDTRNATARFSEHYGYKIVKA
ncbi:MAG: nucleotide sugar dehydrogenase [Pseudomonadota bacterium]|nr:nucleotide sugar dehydrogenase [Pseudomonadota bacterium]